MTRVGSPHNTFKEGDIEGLSGFTFIVESHISVHSYAKQEFISIDVYSCREFDADAVVQVFRKAFGIRKIAKTFLPRGEKFPVMATAKERKK